MRFDFELTLEDYRQYYTLRNLAGLGLGVAAAAPLANTSADMHIRRWYQRRVRGETLDEFADVLNYAGLLWVVVPAGLEGAALTGRAGDGYMLDSGLYEWSNRSLRSIAVGGPPMLLMGAVLGSSRPKGNDSHWHFFRDTYGTSGHAFMGAVPFLTAAAMTENEFLKVPLFLGSFLTGWARINDDRHFFSQVALGWWMAYLAVRRVDDTQEDLRSYTITPTFSPEGAGVALQIRY